MKDEKIPIQNLNDVRLELFEKALREAFELRKCLLVHELVVRMKSLENEFSTERPSAWQSIESLSQLRKLVGGRFQNIRSLWTAAGLPLMEHKGDKSQLFEIQTEGWIEFSNWLSRKGFEARLVEGKEDCLFEIRALQAAAEVENAGIVTE